MSNISLKTVDLEKSFLNKVIFKGVNLELGSGSSLAVTGRNGSGKSTLLKVLAGLIRQNKGTVTVSENGKDVKHDNLHLCFGMISPYLNLYEELTAKENLEFFYDLKCSGNSATNKKENIKYLLEKINLYNRRNDDVKNFSSGMKQRVKLAFAIINNPGILLMDEPRTNLDVEGIDLVYKIAEEHKSSGILVLATNEPEDTKLCNDVISIENFKPVTS